MLLLGSPLFRKAPAPFYFIMVASTGSRNIVSKRFHIGTLERRYKALEAEINEALINKPNDDLLVVALKRRLLTLRDEIFRDQYEDDVEASRPITHH